MRTRDIMKRLTTGGMDERIAYARSIDMGITINDIALLEDARQTERRIRERVKAEVKRRT